MNRGPRGLRRLSRLVNRAALRMLGRTPSSFITLRTRGRRTGDPHRVLLPLYYHRDGQLYLVSAYRRRSDWVRNLLADERVGVERGHAEVPAAARPIPLSEFLNALNDPLGVLVGPLWLRPFALLFVLAWARLGEVIRVELEQQEGPA